jgi:hypothetical protein
MKEPRKSAPLLWALTLVIVCAPQLTTGCRGPAYGHMDLFRQELATSRPVKEWGYTVEDVKFSSDYQRAFVVFVAPGKLQARREVVLVYAGKRGYSGKIFNPDLPHSKPLTVGDVRAMTADLQIFGCKIDAPDSGAVRISDSPTNTAVAYDSKIINAIQWHWYELFDAEPGLLRKNKGVVAITFRLCDNGCVSDVRIDRRTVAEKTALICRQAILEAAPFAPWPLEVRTAATNSFRDVHFTFYVDP